MQIKNKFILFIVFLLLPSVAYGIVAESGEGGGVSLEWLLSAEYVTKNFEVVEIKRSQNKPSETELAEFERRMLTLEDFEKRRTQSKVAPKCFIGFWVTDTNIFPVAANEPCKSKILKYFEENRDKLGLRVEGLIYDLELGPPSLKEDLANYKLITFYQSETPTPQELQELQEQVNVISPPEITGKPTCYVGVIYVKDKSIFIMSNSAKCLTRIADHISENYNKINTRVLKLQTNHEYQAILVLIKEEISNAFEKWQFAEKDAGGVNLPGFRVEPEKNPNGQPYTGLIGDGENTLTFNIFLPKEKNQFLKNQFLIVSQPAIGGIKEDESLFKQGLVKVVYQSPKLCSIASSSESITVELWEKLLFGRERRIDSKTVRFNIYRIPILLTAGQWEKKDSYENMAKFLRGKYGFNKNLIFVFDYYSYNLDRIESLAQRLDRFVKGINQEISSSSDIKPGKIDMIAHSMGGLVARSYIENDNLQGYKNVNKLITLGTPHTGADIAQILWDGCPNLQYDGPQTCQQLLEFLQAMRKLPPPFGPFTEDWGLLGPSVVQMVPHSGFLKALNEKQRLHEDKITYVLIAGTKQWIVPQTRLFVSPLFREALEILKSGQLRVTRQALGTPTVIDQDLERYFIRFVNAISDPNADGTVSIDSAKGIGVFEKAKSLDYPFHHGKLVKEGMYENIYRELKDCPGESQQLVQTKKEPIIIPK
ncbi:alpha/beta hydrolase [Candidatus Woesearchaeota archaeon]|nr:alpha/beta hydrolase [Candidatus Woesearchaeota archaeon]